MDATVDLELGNAPGTSLNEVLTHQSNGVSLDSEHSSSHIAHLVEATLSRQESKYRYAFLSFDALHILTLLNHQRKLAQHVRNVMNGSITTAEQLQSIDNDLHSYRRSMDDYLAWRKRDQPWLHEALSKAMKAFSRQADDNDVLRLENLSQPHSNLIPELDEIFIASQSLRGQHDVWSQDKKYEVAFSSAIGIPRFMSLRYIGGSWSSSNELIAARNRLVVATIGGMSLIVPMIIMTLCKSLITSLTTVCVAVVVFAAALALWPVVYRHLPWVKRWASLGGYHRIDNLGARDVLLVTTAYAAVLVVFVGTTAT